MALDTFFQMMNRPGVEQVRQNEIQAQLDRKMANEAAQRNAIAELLNNRSTQISNRATDLANTNTALEMAQFGNPTYDKPIELNDGSYGQPKYDRTGKFVGFEKMPGYTPKPAAPKYSTKVQQGIDLARMQGLQEGTPQFTRAVIEYTKNGGKNFPSASDKESKLVFLESEQDKFKSLSNKVDEAIVILDRDTDSLFQTTSGLGSLAKKLPKTEGFDLQATLDTIEANLAFDRLQQMRDQSKTGGALGAISIRELDLLSAAVESLKIGQSPEQLRSNLGRIKAQYDRYIEALTKEMAQYGDPSQPAPSASTASQPAPAPPVQEMEELTYNPATGEFE
jgi:hypothetical protein